MMRIAVCLSGQPRFYIEGNNFFNKAFEGIEVDYFIHMWHDESSVGKELPPCSNPQYHKRGWSVETETPNKIIKLFSPIKCEAEQQIRFVPAYDFYKGTNLHHPLPANFISMLYSRKKAGELLKKYVMETDVKYDWVVCSRTDIAIHKDMKQILEGSSSETVLTAHAPGELWNHTHLNDPLIVSNYDTLTYFLDLFYHYEEYWLEGIPFCPHRLQFHHLKLKNAKFKQILAPQGVGWSWIRANGLSVV
mgnify:CR=1 FL=1